MRENERYPTLLTQIYHGCENRYTDVELDQARALYPILDLEWMKGWSLKEGFRHIQKAFSGADRYP
jgi:hypothetical protein